ncbi:Hsp20/alpha crystallin family protein [bacterium]|nr:Hsp20/alpha crystallin family protein [bacterium]MBU1985077.1 Hsp20/alpha crystallin family protein [bacterium]
MNQSDTLCDSPVEAKPRRTTHIRYHYFGWSSSTRPVIAAGATWSPPMDLYETLDECVIEVNLGGIPPEQVRIHFDGCFVQISGQRPEHRESGVRCYHVIEIERGAFGRTVELPAEVDPGTSQATFRDGMLVIRVTKREGGTLPGCFPADSMEGLE